MATFLHYLRNILATLGGAFIGGMVNGQIIGLNGKFIPLPEGVDMKTMEGLIAAMPKLQPIHFVVPFAAHAIGTFVGALIAALLVTGHRVYYALGVSLLFLMGGTYMVVALPAPMWFNALDLLGAYIPVGLLAGWLATKILGSK